MDFDDLFSFIQSNIYVFRPFFAILTMFLSLSVVFKIVRFFIQDGTLDFDFSFPKLPKNKKKIIKSEIKQEIENGTFDIDDASERWAKYYEDEFKAR